MGWETVAILLTLSMTDIDCLYRKAVEWPGIQRLVRIAPFKGSPLLSCGGKTPRDILTPTNAFSCSVSSPGLR